MKHRKQILALLVVIVASFMLSGCANSEYMSSALGDGFGFWDVFVYPMAGIIWAVGKTIGFHNYALTLVFATLIVRSLAWPVYAKSNDMQLKMQIVQPELTKIQKKYEGKDDPDSKQRLQMETMALYKKYGIGMGGCITPIIQMPIFLGFYYAIRKIPASIATFEETGVKHWLDIFNSTSIFGVDLTTGIAKTDAGAWNWNNQTWGIIILAALVGITQVVSIFITNMRQKKQKAKQESNLPDYRKKEATDPKAKTSQMTMKMMLYVMAVMMIVFVIQSPAALGLYWVVGNAFTTLQSYIGFLNTEKRVEKLKSKHVGV
ncbi:MAG: YidC/Oxa1 family membrane protein insertase [Bacilli bacterium]